MTHILISQIHKINLTFNIWLYKFVYDFSDLVELFSFLLFLLNLNC
jgi:hypothetical protein